MPNTFELTEVARWHLAKWSSSESHFPGKRTKRGMWAREPRRESSLSIAEFGATDNSDVAGLSIDSPATRLFSTANDDEQAGAQRHR